MTGQPTGSHTVTQHREVRAPDPHVPAGTAAGALHLAYGLQLRRIQANPATYLGLCVLPSWACVNLLPIRAEVYCCPKSTWTQYFVPLPINREPVLLRSGHTVETQRRHAESMPNPEMEGEVRHQL